MSELVAKIRQLESDDQHDSPEYDDLLSRRRAEIEAAHVRPKCCEPAGKAIRFLIDLDDSEDTDLVKTGRWHIGEHPVTFCPFCSRKLPAMRRKSTGKTCRVTDGGYYCAACNERLQACLCDPMDAAFEVTKEELPSRSKPTETGFYWFMPDEVGCWEPVDIDTASGRLALRRLTRGLCLLEDAPDGQWMPAPVPCACSLRRSADGVDSMTFSDEMIAHIEMGRQRRMAKIAFGSAAKIWLAGSHRPQARTGDKGIWRQIISLTSRKPPVGTPVRDRLSICGRLAVRLAMYLAAEWVL